MKCRYFTNRGLKKARNEDALLVGHVLSQANMPASRSANLFGGMMVAVADGLGGHDCGELASRLVLSELRKRSPQVRDERSLLEILGDVNHQIYQAVRNRQHLRPMGASCAGLVLQEDEVIPFSVGDCVIYEIDDGIRRMFDPNRDVSGKKVHDTFGGMSIETAIAPLTKRIEMKRCYIVATDGLYDYVSEKEILDCVTHTRSPYRLWQRVRERGAPDNVSLVILER